MATWVKHRWGRLIGLVMPAILFFACTPATRFKTLTFFFDGVPGSKPAPPPRQPKTAITIPGQTPRPPRPTPLPIISTHKPVVERQCEQCHVQGGGISPIAMDIKLCDKCHKQEREQKGWSHGPINLGTCIPCHRAHESPYPHLLDKPVPDVCVICHDDVMTNIKIYHKVSNLKRCTECHDPHKEM